MSSGKLHQDSDSRQAVHESRQIQVYGRSATPSKKPRKPRRFEPQAYRKQAHASSVNAIKKRIRDVSRRLARMEDAPADIKLEDERALVVFQQELAAAEAEKTRQKMIKKYHMVRFFERQKATRILKKTRKLLLATEPTDEATGLKAQLHEAEVDLNYTQYHPLIEIYTSLYPPDSVYSAECMPKPVLPKTKPPIWFEVEKAMEEGTLQSLRNRTTATISHGSKQANQKRLTAKIQTQQTDAAGLNRRQRRRQRKNEKIGKNRDIDAIQKHARENLQDEDSDGGFFEK